MNYEIAIPSWRRAALLETKTLPLLASRGIPLERVTVFLDSVDPTVADYEAVAKRTGISTKVSHVKGINAQRKVISRHYPAGTPVVSFDDDVQDVVRAATPKRLEPVADLDTFIHEAFRQTESAGLAVWGVSAVVNPFFMRDTVSEDLKFAIASFWGYFSRPGHPIHDTRVAVKEDYELSLRAWWYDGGLVRFNQYAVKADHYRAPGGCQDSRSTNVSAEAAQQLIEDWPGIVRLNVRRARKGGHAEVLLNRRKRHGGNPATTPVPGAAINTV